MSKEIGRSQHRINSLPFQTYEDINMCHDLQPTFPELINYPFKDVLEPHLNFYSFSPDF